MKLREIAGKLGLQVKCGADKLDADVRSGYVSDLLSDVIAHSRENDLWVTLQIHENTVAVAGMKGLAAIVLVNGRQPEEGTLKKAADQGIPIMVSEMPAFELAGRLYALGLRGTRNGAEEF